jgi:proteic killer suppression protein
VGLCGDWVGCSLLSNELKLNKMIKSFGDKDTQRLFEDKLVLKWKNIEKVARRKLNAIHFASQLKDLTKPPHNRLETLKGEFKGK